MTHRVVKGRVNRNRLTIRAKRGKFARTVTKFFKSVKPGAISGMRETFEALTPSLVASGIMPAQKMAKVDQPIPPEVIEAILAGLSFEEWKALVPNLEPILLSISEDGIRAAFAVLNMTPTPDMLEHVNEFAAQFAADRSAELVGMRVLPDGSLTENPSAEWTITDSTRNMLRSDVETAVREGWSGDEFAQQLADNYGFSEVRAEAIARTEVANADIQGNLAAYRDSGVVVGKILLLSDDHEEDDECDDAADMGEVPIDDDFGGLGDPPFHTNCQCDIAPTLADESDGGPSDEEYEAMV